MQNQILQRHWKGLKRLKSLHLKNSKHLRNDERTEIWKRQTKNDVWRKKDHGTRKPRKRRLTEFEHC